MTKHHPPRSDVVRLDVDGVLDLHHFRPREVPDLVRDYLAECKRHGIHEVRIIHGKGKGVLRAIVQDILANHPDVRGFGPAHDGSGWGVTVAWLGEAPARAPAAEHAPGPPKRWRERLQAWLGKRGSR